MIAHFLYIFFKLPYVHLLVLLDDDIDYDYASLHYIDLHVVHEGDPGVTVRPDEDAGSGRVASNNNYVVHYILFNFNEYLNNVRNKQPSPS